MAEQTALLPESQDRESGMHAQIAALRRHLDLGCGSVPRNPYRRPEVFGVDVRPALLLPGVEVRQANLNMEPIPFPDNYFGSISAFDYLEHVPRILPAANGATTVFTFVCLMSEIWRALAPGGRFYALTPAYPNAEAFQDPTHVNVITARTHEYFCGDSPAAQMYGFTGRFRVLQADFVVHKDARIAGMPNLRQRLRRFKYRMQGRLTHFLWELEAVKDR